MRGKVEERSINESSSNSDPQTIQSNPYGKTNVSQQQQQVINNEAPESEPPPYVAVVQPSSNFQPQSEYVVQNSSLNNKNFQPIPAQQIPHPQIPIRSRHSVDAICPTCNMTVHTRVETISTVITILLAILLFLFCCCLAIIPFLVSSCKRTTHYCPNCGRILGEVREFQ